MGSKAIFHCNDLMSRLEVSIHVLMEFVCYLPEPGIDVVVGWEGGGDMM